MGENHITPTAVEIESARRLMAGAQIRAIRLVRGFASHTPQGRQNQGASLQVQMKATPRGMLEGRKEMRVLVDYQAEARRSPKMKPEIGIGATFELVYQLPEDVTPKKLEIRGFAHTNAMLNSFPYWREYVQSNVARMNLPPLTLPLFRITPPPQAGTTKQARNARSAATPKRLKRKGA